MQQVNRSTREIRLRWLLPILVLTSLWVNYSIANASSLHVDQFAPIVVRSTRLANYGKDPANLAFPAVDPQLFDQVLQDQGHNPSGQTITGPGAATNAAATPSPSATGTPQPGVTLPSILPTTVGVVSTVIGVVPPVVDTVEDLADQIVPGAGEIISGVTDPIIEILPLPTCIPLLINSCP